MNAPAGPWWSDCGLVVRVDESPATTVTDRPFARLGSLAGSDVVLVGEAAHALYLHACPDGVFALDLRKEQAATGATGWVAPASRVTLGYSSVTARLRAGVPPSTSGPSLLGPAPGPWPVLSVRIKDRVQENVLRRGLVLAGRGAGCYLHLKHPKISSRHCVLYTQGGRLWVVDLLSTNGTRVAGERIDAAEVPIGEIIDLGAASIEFLRLEEENQSATFAHAFHGVDLHLSAGGRATCAADNDKERALQARIVALEAALTAAQSADAKEIETQARTDRLIEREAELDKRRELIDQCESDVQKCQTHVEHLEQQFPERDRIVADLENVFAQRKAEIDQRELAVAARQFDCDQRETRLAALEAANKNLQDDLAQREERLRQVHATLEQQTLAISQRELELEQKTSRHASEHAEFAEQAAEHWRQVALWQRTRREQLASLEALSDGLAEREQRLATQAGELDQLAHSLGATQRDLEGQKQRLANDRESLQALEARLQEEQRQHSARCLELEQQRRELLERGNELDAERLRLLEQLQSRQERAQGLEDELALRSARLTKLEQELLEREESTAADRIALTQEIADWEARRGDSLEDRAQRSLPTGFVGAGQASSGWLGLETLTLSSANEKAGEILPDDSVSQSSKISSPSARLNDTGAGGLAPLSGQSTDPVHATVDSDFGNPSESEREFDHPRAAHLLARPGAAGGGALSQDLLPTTARREFSAPGACSTVRADKESTDEEFDEQHTELMCSLRESKGVTRSNRLRLTLIALLWLTAILAAIGLFVASHYLRDWLFVLYPNS